MGKSTTVKALEDLVTNLLIVARSEKIHPNRFFLSGSCSKCGPCLSERHYATYTYSRFQWDLIILYRLTVNMLNFSRISLLGIQLNYKLKLSITSNREIPPCIAANSSVYVYVLLGVHPFDDLENPSTCKTGTGRSEAKCTQSLFWKEVYCIDAKSITLLAHTITPQAIKSPGLRPLLQQGLSTLTSVLSS